MWDFDRINRMVKISGCVAEEVDAVNKPLNHRKICGKCLRYSHEEFTIQVR